MKKRHIAATLAATLIPATLLLGNSQEVIAAPPTGSHVAYMSHPKETANLIEEAAASAPANR